MKVLVSMMSAPASRYAAWMARMISGWVSESRSLLPLQLARPVGEALAPVVRLAQVVGLDHGAHRPVEHQNPPRQERLQQRETLGPGATGSDGGGWWRDDWHERSYEKSPG